MRVWAVGFLAPLLMLAAALLVNGASPGDVLSAHWHSPAAYLTLLATQTALALPVAAAVAVVVSGLGSLVRWVMHRNGPLPGGGAWRVFTAEGAVVGLLLVGGSLGWAPKDTYRSPEGQGRIEVRLPSLLECPLRFYPCSDCYRPVRVLYRDGAGSATMQRGYEAEWRDAERVGKRLISWSEESVGRVVVESPEAGTCLFFPEAVDAGDRCAPDAAVAAYLGGEPIAVVERICRDAQSGAWLHSP